MAFINSHRSVALKTELDLFTVKPTQTCVESGYYQEYRPVTVIDTDAPIEFQVSPSDDYIDLSHTQLELKIKITTENGEELTNAHTVAPVNCLLSSLFEHVSIDLNNKTITPPSNAYHYRSFIETLLNYSGEAKSTHLASSLFVMDEAGKMDDVAGSGFVKRKSMMRNGVIELSGYLHSELMSQDKYLINGVGIRLKFYRSKHDFALMKKAEDTTKYKITIQEAILLVRKAKINPSVLIAHERALSRSNVKIPINRVDIKAITIPSNIQSKMLDNIYIGQLPKRVIIGMVSSISFNNSPFKNPFNFVHNNHTQVTLSADSNTQVRAIKSDFDKGQYLQAYLSMFTSSGVFFADTGNNITKEEYANGFSLLGFDLTEDMSASSNHLSVPRQGSLRLDVQFSKPLPESIALIVYAEFDNLIEIDRDRNIFIDYSS